ncbi:Coactosin [Neolecta irregularis DAH-3]|uniref:Coactosin n=1 Tax=Neolecta irregularis (strain DAH-3) TaxID=1198029 RepID=A0A1U7LR45_NEOID|nr:Coactosin [Neolecta irregularis DAH-3]|eukprot:OLL25022.1 Coactosin [Neolecta irregularis DAH-3]
MFENKNEVINAWDQVRSDKSEIDWLLLSYKDSKSNSLALTATGSGGLQELKGNLDIADAQFGYIRMTYANDIHSRRIKFALITWIGEQCKVMRKARMSIHAADVKNVIRNYSIEVSATHLEDLIEDDIVSRMRIAGGANYDAQVMK